HLLHFLHGGILHLLHRHGRRGRGIDRGRVAIPATSGKDKHGQGSSGSEHRSHILRHARHDTRASTLTQEAVTECQSLGETTNNTPPSATHSDAKADGSTFHAGSADTQSTTTCTGNTQCHTPTTTFTP